MKLLTTSLREKLLANGRANRDADGLPREHGYIDHKPVVKLFTPDAGAATWLLTEIDPDDPDRRLRPVRSWDSAVPNSAMSACPNSLPYAASSAFLSSASLHFTPTMTLSAYADEARAHGAIRA